MLYKIADALLPFLFVLLFSYIVFLLVRIIISRWGKETKNKTEKKGRAKILFKSIDEYEGTRYPDLTTYHVTDYYIDCIIDGEKKTLLCSEYMYNFVQKGEFYDVVYTSDHIELDRKYYPDDFDDYFVDGNDEYDDYDDYEEYDDGENGE